MTQIKRRVKISSILLGISLASNPSFAGLEESIQNLKAHQQTLKETFPGFVAEAYREIVLTHYARTLEDYRKSAYFSNLAIQRSASTLIEVKTLVMGWTKDLDVSRSDFFENLFLLHSVESFFDREKAETEKTLKDLETLKSLFSVRCSERNLDIVRKFSKPSPLYPFQQLPTHSESRSLNFNFSASYSAGGPPPNQAGSYSSGQVSFGTQGGSPLELFNIPSIIRFNKLLEEQWTLVTTIRNEHNAILADADLKAGAFVVSTCISSMTQNLDVIISNGIQVATDHLTTLAAEEVNYREVLKQANSRFREHLEKLNREYFPNLQNNYTSIVNQRLRGIVSTDEAVSDFMFNEMGHLLERHSAILETEYEAKLDSRQLLWNKVLEGDVLFENPGNKIQLKEVAYTCNWGHFCVALGKVIRGD